MSIVLMSQATKPDQRQQLHQQYPTWTFKTPAELTPAEYDEVVVMYGNQPLLKKFLARPTSKLKFLQVVSAGVDYLPLAALKKAGVLVANTSGIHADAISESVMAAMLTVVRGYHAAWENQTGDRQWSLPQVTSTLADQQLLIYGTGQIGQSLAAKAEAFGMHVFGVNTTGHPAPHFEQTVAMSDTAAVLKTANFIVNALPLTPSTDHLFNQALFDQVQQRPMLINIGRGPAVKTSDLIAALDKKQLSWAALDVTEPEPLAPDNPLWQRSDVLITPHISGQIAHFRRTVFPIFAANFAEFVKTGNLARNQVDLSRGY
ncbi:phosphoglycerate dehydrogenase [Lactiplantibacillus sp. WILCCON 0030]|uniref:Phosphoglycerate dehydrogenase n=1 Tax=Lactiplantibacillus brownii TaxID=3069269 RepID=A0ABU1ACH6_9LACO|nr:phosphoglycerate dehydrogenase [Lactiplantibacillus brownii]MDQ7938107.1 phosphoglycerate dehydrogenase [Lactiplantibacillus brownii]